ncbi:hypothetical protein [uncultured Sulfitobacter sp.]|uniref:hypothetical protein n=1 Tax=uncultured Sulfitobacter sp. TaxID=191468 RepID=UPI00260F22E2|nr:hypothetical protein [uncultured Sulfitobacter sp.]
MTHLKSIKSALVVPASLAMALALSACGSNLNLADNITASGTATVSSGAIDTSLDNVSNGSVTSSEVGLVAYATGTNPRRGQIVALAGIEDGAAVGEPVTGGTVTYDTRYNYQVAAEVERSSLFINGLRGSRASEGRATLTADFDNGTLTGNTSDLDVDGQINGQAVTGTATVDYSLRRTVFGNNTVSGTVQTSLDGQIGSEGVIATFHGRDSTTTVAGGLVGVAN